MKFMKLGSKPDDFQADHEAHSIRCVSSELATDFTIGVDDVKFYLHKFPLLSKSNRLQKLASEENSDVVHLTNFPGGSKAFEICAKFCYGMTVSLSPYNVVAARCAAEYLEMTEDVDRGNLIFKIEVFFRSSILRSWKDTIIVLQTTTALLPWSEDVGMTERCIEPIALYTSLDPSCINWSYTYNRKLDAMNKDAEIGSVPKDWWAEDLSELEIDVYKRVMLAVISKGRVEGNVIGEALRTYCLRWLPDCNGSFKSDEVHVGRYKSLIESIIFLLPLDKGVSCSCSFLLKLLKVSILVGVDASIREDLMKDISLKLDEASVRDLLIPSENHQTTVYDVDLVQCLVDRFFMYENLSHDRKSVDENEKISRFVLNPLRCMHVGSLMDGYLAEVARDQNLPLAGFINLLHLIPEAARPVHDGIYSAVDVYLKEHPRLTKGEKKKLCELIDVKKLSTEASMHAAQNEWLPLRMVVQILFYEQVRAAAAIKLAAGNNHIQEQDREIKAPLRSKSLRTPTRLKTNNQDVEKPIKNQGNKLQLLPSRSRRIFDKFWVAGFGHGHGENKSTRTSGSSQTKSSTSSSRKQRYSIS